MDPRSMSRPTVRDPRPMPRKPATRLPPGKSWPEPEPVLRNLWGTFYRWPARSNTLPGYVLERANFHVGPYGGPAPDAGVGTENYPRPHPRPGTHHGPRGNPGPRPNLRVPVDHGPGSEKTVAPHGGIRVHGHVGGDDATALDRCDAGEVGEGMYRREKLSSQVPQGIGNPEPGRVVRYGHYHVYGLDREHALEHLHVPEDRIPPHPVGDSRVGVVVEPENAISQLTRKQNVQRDPPVAASPNYGDSHLFIESQTLHLDFGFRYAGGGFGLSYLPLLPTEIIPVAAGSLALLLACCSYAHIMRPPAANFQGLGVSC